MGNLFEKYFLKLNCIFERVLPKSIRGTQVGEWFITISTCLTISYVAWCINCLWRYWYKDLKVDQFVDLLTLGLF